MLIRIMYLSKFFENYIKGTPQKAVVANRKALLCRLTEAVMDGIEIECLSKMSILHLDA